MAGSLFTTNDPFIWNKILDQYPLVLKKKAEEKKKKDLVDLDKWYQEQLPKDISSRSPKFLTKDEIVKLMKWKLMRGKFRPRLTDLIQQNSADDVKQISEKAFKNSGNIRDAIKELSKLKAVGPATASAIMAASNPELYPFMADEAMQGIPGFKSDYTIPAYIRFQNHMFEKAKILRKAGSEFEWTPHAVELCLWVHGTAKQLGLKVDEDFCREGKRTRTEDDDECKNEKTKKQKTK